VNLSEAARKRRERAMLHAPTHLISLDALRTAIADRPPDPSGLAALKVTYSAIRERVAKLDKQRKPLIEAAQATMWLDYVDEARTARTELAKLNAELDALQRDARHAQGAMLVAQHEFDEFLGRWAKSVLVEHTQPTMACFSGADRDAVRLAALFALRKRTHLTVSGPQVAVPADPRITSAHHMRQALATIAGDLASPLMPLPDAWLPPALPPMSPACAGAVTALAAANEALQRAREAQLARIREHDDREERPIHDATVAALTAELARALAWRDHLRDELDAVHAPWRAEVGRALAAALVEISGDLRDAYGAALVGLQMVEILHKLAFAHDLLWARKYPTGAPALGAARSLVAMLEGADPGSVTAWNALRQSAVIHASQAIAASVEGDRVAAVGRKQTEAIEFDGSIGEETERLAAARIVPIIRSRRGVEGEDDA